MKTLSDYSSAAVNTEQLPDLNVQPVFLSHSRLQQFKYWSLGLVAVLAAIVIWYILSKLKINLGVISFVNVPSPVAVVKALVSFVQLPDAFNHLKSSVLRVIAGFILAGVVGVLLGLLIGRSRLTASLLLPPLEVLRPIPAVAWIPLAILMFPSSEISMIFITFLGALFPILLNTIHGVEGVDPRLIASAKSLGGTKLAIFTEVVIPAALPNIITGLAIGMGTC